jgi:hypothetical protein
MIAATGVGETGRGKQCSGASNRHLSEEPNHNSVVRPCHRGYQVSTRCA